MGKEIGDGKGLCATSCAEKCSLANQVYIFEKRTNHEKSPEQKKREAISACYRMPFSSRSWETN